jgi:hypothetical protein
VLVFAPQIIMWQRIYGRPLLVPQGAGFMRYATPLWSETLFSSRNGLFSWAPLWALGALGLVGLARRRPRIGGALLIALAVAALANGAAWDWWAGGAYGGRRFCALMPAVALGLCWLADALGRRGPAVRTSAAGIFAALLALQLGFLRLYERRSIPWDTPLPADRTWGQLLGAPGRAVLRWTGNPLSWPASLPFALHYRVGPARYEELVGPYLLDERVPTTNPRRVGVRQATIDLAHSPFVITRGRALVPLNRTGRLVLVVDGDGDADAAWNGRSVVRGRLPLRVELPARAIRRGLNELQVAGGEARFARLEETADWPPAWSTTGAP